MKRRDATGRRFPVGRRRSGMTHTLIAALCLSVFICGPAQADESTDTAEEVSLGIASVILTFPYGTGKLLYAGMGGIVGGFSWILSGGNTETAKSIWDPSLHGTYVITPDHLRGRKPVRFFGTPFYEDDEYTP